MIRIAHAYSNLLNLYGSWANPTLLKRYLQDTGYDVEVVAFTIGGYVDISSFDLIYFGAGTERRMILALQDFRRFLTEVKDYIEDERSILLTGNSMAVFGNTVTDISGIEYQGISLIDIDTKIHSRRNYSELIMSSSLTEHPVIGNINSSIDIYSNNETPMFRVVKETSGSRKEEGVFKDRIYATELSGPLLVRNPYLLHRFAELLAEKELPLNNNSWFTTALEGYQRATATLKRELI